MRTDGDSGFRSQLATRWSWAADSLSIAFVIDSLALWHDGKPVTASDVKFSFKGKLQEEELAVTYTGKVEGKDSMKGTVKFGELGEGTWTAKK